MSVGARIIKPRFITKKNTESMQLSRSPKRIHFLKKRSKVYDANSTFERYVDVNMADTRIIDTIIHEVH